MKEEFAAVAIHEVNTPIAATQGYLSMILGGKTGPLSNKILKILSQAYKSSLKTQSLIKKILGGSKLEELG